MIKREASIINKLIYDSYKYQINIVNITILIIIIKTILYI